MEFSLADVKKVNADYLYGDTLERSIAAAMADRILIDSVTEDDSTIADSSSRFSGSGACSGSDAYSSTDFSAPTGSRSSSGGRGHFFRFATTMWHETVMRTMLSDRQVELHKNVALSMEAEGISETTDTKTLLKLFEHWKACTEFGKNR